MKVSAQALEGALSTINSPTGSVSSSSYSSYSSSPSSESDDDNSVTNNSKWEHKPVKLPSTNDKNTAFGDLDGFNSFLGTASQREIASRLEESKQAILKGQKENREKIEEKVEEVGNKTCDHMTTIGDDIQLGVSTKVDGLEL